MRDDLKSFFLNPRSSKQRQYEALRAYVVDGLTAQEVARRFDFSEKSIYALAHYLRVGQLELFPQVATGPKDRRVTSYIKDLIYELRKKNLSVPDIVEGLHDRDITLSASTVERILKDAGYGRLPKRAAGRSGLTRKNTMIPQPSHNIDFKQLKPFRADCQVAGVYFFLPYIIESGIIDLLDLLPLPGSERIGKEQAFLSLLALKLIGGERLCHVRQYDHDAGFGLFAGLNVLPKPTYMGTYSCLVDADVCNRLQKDIVSRLCARNPDFFSGSAINLDFHSIPHFGEKSEMEKVWCGARNKAMKGANAFFAQDAETKALLYTNADVLRKDGAFEVLNFVNYWEETKGVVKETLVFDSRLTTYEVLGKLDACKIKFITLRRRCKTLEKETQNLPDSNWQRVKLPIPKRKHQRFLAYESEVCLKGCPNPLRQIIMKEHGRMQPTYVITNNWELSLLDVLKTYARRWRIENKLSELVDFFNLNSLSSPIMIRIYFDLLLSIVASFLYRRFSEDLPRFEKCLAPEIFRHFVDIPGTIEYDGVKFDVRIRKRAHTPILMGVKNLQKPITVPWLDKRQIRLVFKP
jgi:transposase